MEFDVREELARRSLPGIPWWATPLVAPLVPGALFRPEADALVKLVARPLIDANRTVAQGIAGELALAASAAQVAGADRGLPGFRADAPVTQAARLALAEGFGHPGRALTALREGPDTGVAWLAGLAEMAAEPVNYVGGPIGKFGAAAKLPAVERLAKGIDFAQRAPLELPARALGLAAKSADARLLGGAGMRQLDRGLAWAIAKRAGLRAGRNAEAVATGRLPLDPGKGEWDAYQRSRGLPTLPREPRPVVKGVTGGVPDEALVPTRFRLLDEARKAQGPKPTGQRPLAPATSGPGERPSLALGQPDALAGIASPTGQRGLRPADNAAGDKASSQLTQGLDADQAWVVDRLRQALRDGDQREAAAIEEYARDVLEVRPDTIARVKDEIAAIADAERAEAAIAAIERSPYPAVFKYFHPDGTLRRVNPKTGEALRVREGGKFSGGRAEVWNIPGSGYDEIAAAATEMADGGHNQAWGTDPDDFWPAAREAFLTYRALKAGKPIPAGISAYSGPGLGSALAGRLGYAGAGGAAGFFAGAGLGDVDPATGERLSPEDAAKRRLAFAAIGAGAGFAGGGAPARRVAGGRLAGDGGREAVARWLLGGSGEAAQAGLAPAQRAGLLQIAPDFDAQLRSFARDPERFDPARFRAEALANATADDLSDFFARNLPNIQAGKLTRDEVLAAIVPTRLSIRRGPVGDRGLEKVTAAYPELADQLDAARIAGGPDGGKVRPEDIAAVLLRQSDEGRAIAAAIKAGDHGALARALEAFKAVWPGSIMGHEGATLHDAANKLGPLTDFINQRASRGASPGTLADELIAGGPDVPRVAGIAQGKVPFALWQIGAGQGRPTFDSKVIAALREGATPATYRALLEELYPWARGDMGKAHQLFWDATQGAQTPHTGLRGLQEAVRGGEALGAGLAPQAVAGALKPAAAGLIKGIAAGGEDTLRDRAFVAEAIRTGQEAWRAAQGRQGVKGVKAGALAGDAQWRRQVTETLRNLLQNAADIRLKVGEFGRDFGGVGMAEVGRYRKLGREEWRLADLAQSKGGDVAWLRDVGHAGLLDAEDGLLPLIGTGATRARLLREAAEDGYGAAGRVAAGATIGAVTGAARLSPLSPAIGAARGYFDPFIHGAYATLESIQQSAPRRAFFQAALDRDLPALAGAFLDSLAGRGIDVAALRATGGRFDRQAVENAVLRSTRDATLAASLADDWQLATEATIRGAGDAVVGVFGDFRGLSPSGLPTAGGALKTVASRLFPFSSWAVAQAPILARMAARHPLVVYHLVQAYRADAEAAKRDGRKGYQVGTLPVSTETPVAGALARARLGGQAGTVRLDPLGLVSPAGGELALPDGETPDNAYQAVTQRLGMVGLSPHPLIQALAYAVGADWKQPNLNRYGGAEQGATYLLNRLAEAGGGAALPELPGSGAALSGLREMVTGRPGPVTDPVVRRYDELVVARTGRPIDAPGNAARREAIGDMGDPLWRQAVREALLAGAAGTAFSLASPVSAGAQSAERVAADRARAGLPYTGDAISEARAAGQTALAARMQAENDRYTAGNPAAGTYAITRIGQVDEDDLRRFEMQASGIRGKSPATYRRMRDQFVAEQRARAARRRAS